MRSRSFREDKVTQNGQKATLKYTTPALHLRTMQQQQQQQALRSGSERRLQSDLGIYKQ